MVNWRASVATAVFPLAPCNKSEKNTQTQFVYCVYARDNQGKQELPNEEDIWTTKILSNFDSFNWYDTNSFKYIR